MKGLHKIFPAVPMPAQTRALPPKALAALILLHAVLSVPARAEAAGQAPVQAPPGAAAGADSSAGAGTDSTMTESDSTTAAADSAAVEGFSLVSESSIKFTESSNEAETGVTVRYSAGDEWVIDSNLMVGKKSFRGRDMDMIFESFTSSATKLEPSLYIFDISLNDTYDREKSLGLSRYGKQIVQEKESAGFNFILTKPLLKASKSKVYVAGEASRGQQDFKYNRTVTADLGGHFNYAPAENFRISAGVGTNLSREESRVEYIEFGGMPSHSDTLKARLVIGKTKDKKLVNLTYKKEIGTIREAQPPFGNSMEILDDPELVKEERNDKRGEVLIVESAAKVSERISMDVTFNRNYSDQKFMIEDRRNKEYETKNIKAGLSFKYHSRGTFGISLKRSESDTELGPTSIASYRTRDYSLSGSLSQALSDSLSMTISASTSMNQKFFKKRAQNPRDADYLNSSLDCELDGHLFHAIKTTIAFSTLRTETINIDASLSGDNRVDFQYLLSPRLEFDPVPWIKLWQKYEIKLDYTEFTFDPDRNYLDRNTSLETDASLKIFKSMKLGLNHNYQMKDTGSYLSRTGGEKLYGPTNENFEHRLRLKCDYNPSVDMLVFVRTTYKTQTSNSLGTIDGKRRVISTSGSDSGDMKVGFERTRKIADTGKLDLDVAYVKRYGPFISEDRKQYWEINMNITLEF